MFGATDHEQVYVGVWPVVASGSGAKQYDCVGLHCFLGDAGNCQTNGVWRFGKALLWARRGASASGCIGRSGSGGGGQSGFCWLSGARVTVHAPLVTWRGSARGVSWDWDPWSSSILAMM